MNDIKRNRLIVAANRKAEVDFVDLMADERFRAFIWERFKASAVFDALPNDPFQMTLAEGMRRSMLDVQKMINRLCPQHYETMAREAQRREDMINGGPSNPSNTGRTSNDSDATGDND